MKKTLTLLIAAVVLLSLCLSGCQGFSKTKLEYTTENDGGEITCTITGIGAAEGGRLVIPKKIEGHRVTAIDSDAFVRCTGLTKVTIPEGVTSIGNSAFYGCTSLAEVTIPEGVTYIGESAFEGCTSLAEVAIPEGVTGIGAAAFYRCTGLKKIVLPNSLGHISSDAFSGCDNVEIEYNGTMAEWKNIGGEKIEYDYIKNEDHIFVVHCTDGNVSVCEGPSYNSPTIIYN